MRSFTIVLFGSDCCGIVSQQSPIPIYSTAVDWDRGLLVCPKNGFGEGRKFCSNQEDRMCVKKIHVAKVLDKNEKHGATR